MLQTTLIVPGLGDSNPDHWQSWIEPRVANCRRVQRIVWDSPVLAHWATEVRREIDEARGVVWIVAHGFGCLASVVAAADRPDRVAGLLLVAPADPARFSPTGLRDAGGASARGGLAQWIPCEPLGVPSLLVASRNDPWSGYDCATRLADNWGSLLVDAGLAGHLNAESGFGPWPRGLEHLAALQRSYTGLPLGSLDEVPQTNRGKRGALARLRHRTRFDWDVFAGLVG